MDTSILETVARATRLREGPAGVAAVLRAVYRAGSLRLQEAAREARLPLPVATAIRRELEKAGLLERKHGLSLTETGQHFVETALGLAVTHDMTCPACGGRGIVIPEKLRASVERLAAIVAGAPPVDVTLDQCPCVPDTAMLRALLMLKNGALEGRRVLILGDDDSLSVAIGLAGRALRQGDLTRGVTVIESDPRRVDFLRAAAASEEIAIEVVAHDLRDPLPAQLARAFDVVATDPPYTLGGAKLFLGRGAEALTGDGACYFSFTQWPPPQLAELQRLFLDLGFVVRALHQGFNRYLGAGVLGNVGDLIELTQIR
ncbi:MAG TPA: bis-aminopropyl spermidine synthase family protein, partial [Xanthobacteraceae bacterium]|nr:bis-aminopropyl spermidine synthase family protein [Xanthobacteraceae bacterium]